MTWRNSVVLPTTRAPYNGRNEKKGRKIASTMGITIVGLLGIFYLNIKRNFITAQEAQEFLDQTRANGFRISQKLIDDMLGNLV